MRQKTIFDLLNDICYNKIKWTDQTDADKKQFQPYMITRWLSMHPDYLDLIAECQVYTSALSAEQLYNFYLDLLPKKKFFTKYISSKSEKKYDKVTQFLSPKLEISTSELEDYLSILMNTDSGLDAIKSEIRKYGYDDKKIKKEFQI